MSFGFLFCLLVQNDFKYFFCAVDLVILDKCINKTSENDVVLHNFIVVIKTGRSSTKDLISFFELAKLAICLDENPDLDRPILDISLLISTLVQKDRVGLFAFGMVFLQTLLLEIFGFHFGDSLVNLDCFLWHLKSDTQIHKTVEQEVLDLVTLVAGHCVVDVGEHLVQMLLDDEHLLLVLHTDQLALRQRLEPSKQLAKTKVVGIDSFGVEHLVEDCKGFS